VHSDSLYRTSSYNEGIFANTPLNEAKVKRGQESYFDGHRGSEDLNMRMFADICTYLGNGCASSSSVERINGEVKSIVTSKRSARLNHGKVNTLLNVSTVYRMDQSQKKKTVPPREDIFDHFHKDLQEATSERRALDALSNQVDEIDLDIEDEDIGEDDNDGWFEILLENRVVNVVELREDIFDLEDINIEEVDREPMRRVRRRGNNVGLDIDNFIDEL
jgi:hypothetical protein